MEKRQSEKGRKGLFERGTGLLEQGCTFLASLSFVVMLSIITIGTLSRYLFNYPFSFVDEYSGYLLVAMGFLGMASALRREAHISVEIVTKSLPGKVRNRLGLINYGLAIMIGAILFWISLKLCYENYSIHMLSSTMMETPLWIPQAFIPLGWAVFILLLLVRIRNGLRKVLKP